MTDRLAVIDDEIGFDYLEQLPFTADMRYVTLNSSVYGGSGGSFAVYAGNNISSTEVALHEVAHSFAHLADEYDYGGGSTYTGAEPSEVNVTKSASGAKWSEWLGYVDGELGVIGAYEGARYFENGLYRPTASSKMRDLERPFDAIGREAFIREIYDLVRPIDAALSTSQTVGSSATLWADVVDPQVVGVRWFVDDQLVAGATGAYFVPAQFGFGSGTHTVTMEAYDDTEWVRRGKSALRQEREWNISGAVSTAGLLFSTGAAQLELTEGDGDVQYQLQLSQAPTQPVTLTIHGNSELIVSPSTIVFTPEDWNTPRTLTMTALSDAIVDGDDIGEISYDFESLDTHYANLIAPTTRSIVHDTTIPAPGNRAPTIVSSGFTIDPTTAQNGSLIGTLLAIDPDLDQSLTWAIQSGNESGLISIDPQSGELFVNDASLLNPEEQSEIYITVTVTDNGTPPLSANAVVVLSIQVPAIEPEVNLEIAGSNLVYQTPGSSLLLVPDATVQTVGGSGSLQGMSLIARSTGKRSGKDRINITLTNGQDSEVTLAGSNVLHDGIQIGTIVATKPKAGFKVQFSAQASDLAVQAVVRQLAFQTTAKKRAPRTVAIQLVDYDGADSATKSVAIAIQLLG